jgi:ABC-2 type transport system permease protein
VATVLRLRTEEREGRLAPVLAGPVSRRRWMLSYLTVAVVGTVAVMAASGLALVLGYLSRSGDAGLVLPVLGASLAMAPAIAVLAGAAFVLVGLRPAWATAAWAGVAVSGVVGFLAETLNLPQWMRDVSPFEHVPALPAAAFEAVPVAVLTLVASASVLAALALMQRRDIA